MEAVDYFAGAGNASQGIHEAGYTVTSFDHWPVAVATHNLNLPGCHVHDLSDPIIDHLLPRAPFVWFSPPCQPFSAAGDGEGEFDDRDGFPWALRILALHLPAVAIFENVKGVTFAKHSQYFGSILETVRQLGYDVQWTVLNSADYGVPQTRERCFIIARRDGGRIIWPTVTHTEQPGLFTDRWVSFAEAVPSVVDRIGVYRRGTGLTERHGDRPAVRTDRPAPTVHRNTEKDLILHYRQNNRDGEPITCDLTDRPSPTVGTLAECQWIVAGRAADTTRLTVSELAHLQDFPDWWQFAGTKTDQARQVGNACPRTMSRLLAEANRPVAVRVAA